MLRDTRFTILHHARTLAIVLLCGAALLATVSVTAYLTKNQQRPAATPAAEKPKLYRQLKEQAVYDFAYCAFEPDGMKATTVDDIKVVRALAAIKRFEVQICGRASYWYNCGGFWCWLERDRNIQYRGDKEHT